MNVYIQRVLALEHSFRCATATCFPRPVLQCDCVRTQILRLKRAMHACLYLTCAEQDKVGIFPLRKQHGLKQKYRRVSLKQKQSRVSLTTARSMGGQDCALIK